MKMEDLFQSSFELLWYLARNFNS